MPTFLALLFVNRLEAARTILRWEGKLRRRDRENNGKGFLDSVFQQAEVLTLAFYNGQYPYCVPFNFARVEERIYIHSAREGLKLECIAGNPHVAFNIYIDTEIDQKNATTYYKSICGTGVASIVEDTQEKCMALDALAVKYNALCKMPCPPENAARVAIIRIDIQTVTGKGNMKKAGGDSGNETA